MTSTQEADAEEFFGKWQRAWPSLATARLFCSDGEWPKLRARVGVSFEVAEALWLLSDATVREHKLMWWHDELERHGRHEARHPLLLTAPTLALSPRIVAAAISALHEGAPVDASRTLTRIARLAAHTTDDETAHVAGQTLMAAMFLLVLRTGTSSSFAQAPLDLRARFAVADAASGVALNALVAALAESWRGELRLRYVHLSRQRWQGARGLRVLTRLALELIEALARGAEPPVVNAASTMRAWLSVVGMR